MVHLFFFASLLSLLLGVYSISVLLSESRSKKKRYLKKYALYLVFFNVAILFFALLKYVNVNVDKVVFGATDLTNMFVINSLDIVVMTLSSFAFHNLTFELKGKSDHQLLKIHMAAGGVLFLGSLMDVLLWGENYQSGFWLISNKIYSYALIILILYQCGTLMLRKGSPERNNKVQFGVVQFAIYFVLIMVDLTGNNELNMIVLPLLFLAINFYPLVFINQFNPSQLVQAPINRQAFDNYQLSPREREIVEFLARGYSNREIGDRLFISPNTVKNHVYTIFQKLEIKSRGELIRSLYDVKTKAF